MGPHKHLGYCYRFGPFSLDGRRRVLLRDRELVPITSKVFDTLLLLVENSGQVLLKDDMMESLWSEHFVEESNLIQNIATLRKALGEYREWIQTIPKRGYRFAVEVQRVDEKFDSEAGVLHDQSDLLNTKSQSPNKQPPHNLPSQLTTLIGREAEIRDVESLMRRDDVRLLTLTGPGGTGKTRLSLQLADLLCTKYTDGKYTDGVFVVALAPINDSELVASAIAHTLGIKETGSISLVESIKEYLRGKQMLLVLDNFEQVITASSLVAELLMASPQLKVLVTSREPLRVRGEHEFAVHPLTPPDPKQLPPINTLKQNAAVELFVERASAKSDFMLTNDNMLSVAEICARLDGLPLAIELAAARIKELSSPQAILARLESRFKLLVGGARDLPERQRTMRGAIAWSYDPLSEGEKKLFRRLSVFAGGCTLEAGCCIAGDMEIYILDAVASLVDKSLLWTEKQSNNEPRFMMLETIREYGLEQLEASAEAELVRRQHATFFLKLAEQAGPKWWKEREGLDQLEREHDNFRAALKWAMTKEGETGLHLADSLADFWLMRSYITEGRMWLEKAIQSSGSSLPSVRASALIGMAYMMIQQGDYTSARSSYGKALVIGEELRDKKTIGHAHNGLGHVALSQGDYASARSRYSASLKAYKELRDEAGIAGSLNNLGEVAQCQGNYQLARSLYEEGLAICKRLGNRRGTALVLGNLGNTACQQGDYESAGSHYKESLTTYREFAEKLGVVSVLVGVADLAATQRQPERAAQLLGATEYLYETTGTRPNLAERAVRDRAVANARAALGEESFSAALAEGRAMSLEQAIAYALE
jgi:predicted ATPase/DNA-binding winged helix-turn-helix (wHTH) protein/Tfp pilus assembly protein PilF